MPAQQGRIAKRVFLENAAVSDDHLHSSLVEKRVRHGIDRTLLTTRRLSRLTRIPPRRPRSCADRWTLATNEIG
jgi:hypothetical protein